YDMHLTQQEGNREREEDLDITDIQAKDEEGRDEEQAALKIQSNFRGYKGRKNLKDTTRREEEEVERPKALKPRNTFWLATSPIQNKRQNKSLVSE
uniref:Uncharacterized protein n=1 Tax=Electrophorus electricus TaxID=8005 RepID=A0A4W4E7K0_ELEEL